MVGKIKENYFFRKFCGKKHLRLIDYGLFAEETFADLGKKRNTFFRKHFLPLK